jgi:hypothetical protein
MFYEGAYAFFGRRILDQCRHYSSIGSSVRNKPRRATLFASFSGKRRILPLFEISLAELTLFASFSGKRRIH